MYQRLLLQHRLLRLPHLFHNRLHFCHILFINIPDTVNSFCNLIQIPTNLSKCFISIALDKNNLHHKQIQRVLVSGCNPKHSFSLTVPPSCPGYIFHYRSNKFSVHFSSFCLPYPLPYPLPYRSILSHDFKG